MRSPILLYRMGTVTSLCSHTCICNVILRMLEYRRPAAAHSSRWGTKNKNPISNRKSYITHFRTNFGPCVHTDIAGVWRWQVGRPPQVPLLRRPRATGQRSSLWVCKAIFSGKLEILIHAPFKNVPQGRIPYLGCILYRNRLHVAPKWKHFMNKEKKT
jgi:hypothetical protein